MITTWSETNGMLHPRNNDLGHPQFYEWDWEDLLEEAQITTL